MADKDGDEERRKITGSQSLISKTSEENNIQAIRDIFEDFEKEAEEESVISKRVRKEIKRRSSQQQSSKASKNDVFGIYSRPMEGQ